MFVSVFPPEINITKQKNDRRFHTIFSRSQKKKARGVFSQSFPPKKLTFWTSQTPEGAPLEDGFLGQKKASSWIDQTTPTCRMGSQWMVQWFITVVIVSPLGIRLLPFQTACKWLINGGDPNYLLTGMILQEGGIVWVCREITCFFFKWWHPSGKAYQGRWQTVYYPERVKNGVCFSRFYRSLVSFFCFLKNAPLVSLNFKPAVTREDKSCVPTTILLIYDLYAVYHVFLHRSNHRSATDHGYMWKYISYLEDHTSGCKCLGSPPFILSQPMDPEKKVWTLFSLLNM